MAKKEIMTNLWVYDMLKEIGVQNNFSAQGSNIKEIDEALATASKKGTGNVGFPEYVGVINDFLIVIEDKASLNKHINRNEKDLIAEDVKSVTNYTVNGALFYGKHLAKNTTYKKIIAIGVSGDEKNHKISPLFIDERGGYKELDDVETFISFSAANINEYYEREILEVKTNDELKTEELLKVARSLHEDLRNYGNLEDKNKPLIVSGILLALSEIEHKNFDISDLIGDTIRTDGSKIYKAIEDNLKRANVSPEVKRDKLLNQFNIIRDNNKINEKNSNLGKTPLRYFTELLYNSIFTNIKYGSSTEDYIGRFYGEFMSYSGGDGQSLGIILTPRHITDLFCELLDIQPTDKVLDPCCGTAGFLIAAMHQMLSKTEDEVEQMEIRKNRLFGIELQDYMFTIATTNMILRGDGKSNLENQDFLAQNPSKIQLKGCTVGMMNPPYSQGSKQNPELYEINFVNHLLESLVEGAKIAVIVPQSTFTGKTKDEQNLKTKILNKHTLEGVITLNKNTFYGVGTNPCIGIFTAGIPHRKTKKAKFINFENDGFIVSKHIGLIDDGSAKDKKQHLLDVWNDEIEAPTKFCVETTVEDTDEWLHSFYYFNDEIPSDEDFEKTIADYLTFEVNMITHGRGYLFGLEEKMAQIEDDVLRSQRMVLIMYKYHLKDVQWKEFFIGGEEGIFDIKSTKSGIDKNKLNVKKGKIPYITRSDGNNGINLFVTDEQDKKYKMDQGNVITIGLDTQTVFYQANPFFTGQNIQVLSRDNLNKNISMFIIPLIKIQMEKFNWGGNGATLSRLNRTKIMLPTKEDGNPNWHFMEEYIKEREIKQRQNLKEYYKNRLLDLL